MTKAFYNLQQAGLLPKDARMGSELTETQQSQLRKTLDSAPHLKDFETPVTYEAAFRVLVTDVDGNRKLDIDADLVARSGLLSARVDGQAVAEVRHRVHR